MTHPFFLGTRHPRVFAHRGLVPSAGGGGIWENTAVAFAAAHAAGAEYIETDCRVTADGEVVLVHDETLERLAGDPRRVAQVGTRELANMFADHGGLLTVADALDGFPETRFNLDVKTIAAAAPLGRILAPHTERVLVTSFDDRCRVSTVAAVIEAGATLRPATSGGRTAIATARAATAMRLSPVRALRGIDALQIPERHRGIRVFTPALVRAAHALGVEVHVWTVNDLDDVRRLVAAGADGVVTDRADAVIDSLH